jgi:hypothetical protein
MGMIMGYKHEIGIDSVVALHPYPATSFPVFIGTHNGFAACRAEPASK